MSFDKDYPNRKDKRKPYRGSRAIAHSCRHGGTCSRCRGDRTIATKRVEERAKELSTSYTEN
jgi:ferredoxin